MAKSNFTLTKSEAAAVGRALTILKRHLTTGPALSTPTAVRNYLSLKYGLHKVEVFSAIWLNTQNMVIAIEEISKGTLDQTSVFPREVIRSAIEKNAAGVIFAHNHPSGVAEPSRADATLTQALKEALAMVGVRVLDHFIVGGHTTLSFAERGML